MELLPNQFDLLFAYATLSSFLNRFDEALPIYEAAVSVARRDRDPRLAVVLNDLGVLYHEQERLHDAERTIGEARVILRDAANRDSEDGRNVDALTLLSLGNVYADQNRPADAYDAYDEAVRILSSLEERSSDASRRAELAILLNNIGSLFANAGRLDDARRALKEALRIYQSLEEVQLFHLPGLALALQNLGHVEFELGRWKGAVAAYGEAVGVARRLAEVNPSFTPELAELLTDLGEAEGRHGLDKPASGSFSEAARIYRELVSTEGDRYQSLLSHVLNSLAVHHGQHGRFASSRSLFEEALAIRRELATIDATEENRAALANTLNGIAALLMKKNEITKARDFLQESVELFGQLVDDDFSAYGRQIALVHRNLAHIETRSHRVDAAEAELAKAAELLRRLTEIEPADNLSELASTLDMLGRFLWREDRAGATSAFDEALERRKQLVAIDLERYGPSAAAAMVDLGVELGRSDMVLPAQESLREALRIYLRLSEAAIKRARTGGNRPGQRRDARFTHRTPLWGS